ncbi:MAG TPA: phosphate acyltransferase, partial [Candidatus Pacearchaeota archaeon]|nr:phosphate acyltransferase [Candidatus Pacearchaeota archaeon]HPO75538.1 phosphate acyltransferase [Candidatus Pacearchaeota archaeon]
MKKIIFPEGEDERIISAAKILKEKEIAEPILISKKNIEGLEIINPEISKEKEELSQELSRITGFPLRITQNMILHHLYFGAMMLKTNKVDAMIGGAIFTSAEVLTVATQVVGLEKGISIPSSYFLMEIPNYEGGENGKLIFADASVSPNPQPQCLADIAITTARTAKRFFNWEP